VAALPALTLDAAWLDLDGANSDARDARARRERIGARAATSLDRVEHALAARAVTARSDPVINQLAQLRFAELVASERDQRFIFDGIDRCALCLARALGDGPDATRTMARRVIASELVTVIAVSSARPGNARPSGRHRTRPTRAGGEHVRPRRARRRRPRPPLKPR
jgi:hypothetical protein